MKGETMMQTKRVALLGSMVFAGLLVIALFGALLWTVQSSQAVDRTVGTGGTYDTILAAISDASAGDIIKVRGGETFTESLVITKSLTLEGGYNAGFTARDLDNKSVISLTLPAGTYGRAVKIEGSGLDVTIDGFEIKGGNLENEPGSGLYVDMSGGSHIFLINNLIHDNSVTREGIGSSDIGASGGGMRLDLTASTGQIQGNDILSNTAGGFGGGIWLMLDQVSHIDVVSNTFRNNTSESNGAGLGGKADRSTLTALDNLMFDNDSDSWGGGFYLDLLHGSDALITSTQVISNGAGAGSGLYAVLNHASSLRVGQSEIERNSAFPNQAGGGLYLELNGASTVDLMGNEIISNTADKSGGGMYIEGVDRSTATIISNTVSGNEIDAGSGAGIYAELVMSSTFLLNNNQVISNTNFTIGRVDGGGGVYAKFSDFTYFEVNHNDIISNTAVSKDWGGVYIIASHHIEGSFEHNIIRANQAPTDGGDYGGSYFALEDNVAMAFGSNDFSENRARDYGGLGMEIANHSQVIGDHLAISNNEAGTGYGGASVSVLNHSVFTMTEGITVTGNVAHTGEVGGIEFRSAGGGLGGGDESHSSFFIPNMYIHGNRSEKDGGGASFDFGIKTKSVATGACFSNNTVNSGNGGGVGISLGSESLLNLSDSLFVSNEVSGTSGAGGGLYLTAFDDRSVLNLRRTEFLTNTATDQGGGAYIAAPWDGAYLDLKDARFIHNRTVMTGTGQDDGGGGGLYLVGASNSASVYAKNVRFESNAASGAGGGMYLDKVEGNATVNLNHSVFLSNTAVKSGGGLWGDEVPGGSYFHQNGSVFSYNASESDGGAIYWDTGLSEGSVGSFDYITVTHNEAAGGGGGIYVSDVLADTGALVSLTHSRILSNTSQGAAGGGGVYLGNMAENGGIVYFNRNVFQGNQARIGRSGGVRLGNMESSHMEFKDNQVLDNTAAGDGGGLYIGIITGGTFELSGNEISQNAISSTLQEDGGGLYIEEIAIGTIFTATDNVISNNRATGRGAGCYIDGGMVDGLTFLFLRNQVDHNIAGGDGGGCYVVDVDNNISSSQVQFIDNVFNSNTAVGNYGGVFIGNLANSYLRFWNNQLIDNRAGISGTTPTGGDGGGIYFAAINAGSVVDFRDNDVINNTAYISPTGELGAYGGLYAHVEAGSLLSIHHSRFEHNEAKGDYAGVYVELLNNARLMMARSVVTGNVAADEGGGVSIVSLEDKTGFSQYSLERNKIINNSSDARCGLSIIDVASEAPPLWGRSTNNVIAGNSCGVHLEDVDFRSTNDTIADHDGAGFSVAGTLTSTIYLNNGILWGNTINLTTTELLTQSRFIKESSYEGTANIFVDADGRDYHLKPGASVVINQANDDLAPAVDHDGVPRPVGTKADIGAYEYRMPGVTVGGDGLVTALPGEIVTHTVTITNAGTAQDVFDLALSANTWPATLSTADVTLDAGESISVYVWVEAPLGLSQGEMDITRIIATSQRNAGNTHSADLETEVGLAPAVSLTPDNSAVAPDNSIQRYQHVLVNEGNGSDTFVLTASSSQEWMTHVISRVTLAEGVSETVEVTVWIPKGANGLVDTTIVTATSISDRGVFTTARNRTTIVGEGTPAVLSLTPDRAANVIADRSHVYTHTLTNLATQPDTFTLTVVSDTGWPVTLSAVTETLTAGASATVYVTVTVPADSAHQQVDVTTVTATSRRNPRVKDAVSDRTTALRISDLELSTLSPRHVAADTAIDYVHVLTNHTHLTDIVTLTATSSQGWPVMVSPPTMILAGGAQGEVTVTVSVPLTSTHGDADQTQLTAISDNDGKQISVADMTTARKQSNLDLYPDRTGTAIVGTDKVYTHTLENNGTYTDTVILASSGPDSNWLWSLHPISVELGSGMSTTVVLTVSVPVAERTGEYVSVSLDATSGNDGQVVGAANLTTAQRPSNLSLSSNNPTGVLAGQQRAYYQHTLTNDSAVTDTVALTATSSQGWAVDVGPRTVTLGPDMDATVAVTLSLPADGSNGTMDITTVEARSDNGGGALDAAASNVTTLLNPASIQLRANQTFSTEAGSTVVYEHSLVNAGDYQDVFSIEAASEQGWQINLSHYQARLSPGVGVSITLQVTAPATATAGVVDQTTLSVISTYDRDQLAPVTNVDTTVISGGKIYLPLVLRNS